MCVDPHESGHVEQLLAEIRAGRVEAKQELSEAVYQQLRTMADRYLRRRFGKLAGCLTLQPTALVNETLLRVIRQRQQCDTEGHFFAIASTVMKRVLIDYAREKAALKRGGGRVRIQFNPQLHSPTVSEEESDFDVEALFDALDRLTEMDARRADVARMRILWGLEIEAIAVSLGVSRATVERDWRFAKAWLGRELGERESG